MAVLLRPRQPTWEQYPVVSMGAVPVIFTISCNCHEVNSQICAHHVYIFLRLLYFGIFHNRMAYKIQT